MHGSGGRSFVIIVDGARKDTYFSFTDAISAADSMKAIIMLPRLQMHGYLVDAKSEVSN